MHTLDWAHAYTGRLDFSAATQKYAPRISGCVERLKKHLQEDSLPFLSLSFQSALENAIPAALEQISSCKHMLLLGIGGSSLGGKALQKAFCPEADWPHHNGRCLWIADNIDAAALTAWMNRLDPRETVVVCISKSGGTIETMAQYFLVRAWMQETLGDAWKKHVVLVTDEQKGELRAEANQLQLTSMPVPDNLGGRFSVFSAVGMLPCAFLGVDYKALLRGARAVSQPLLQNPAALGDHPAFRLAQWNMHLMEKGYSQLIFFGYIPSWQYLGAWFAQLWAESLGKQGKGSMPVPAVGVTDQHSVNQMFLDGPKDKGCLFVSCESLDNGPLFPNTIPDHWSYLRGKRFGELLHAECLGTRMALVQNTVPLVHVRMDNTQEEAAARFMQLTMLTTVLTGWLLDIDPLDQPAVELGKRLANARLGAEGYAEEARALGAFLNTPASQSGVDSF